MSDAARSDGSQPASDLGAVWDALDALPRATAPIDMAATTIDMAAVTAARSPTAGTIREFVSSVASSPGWLWPAVAVAASLVGGVVLGRLAAPDPDARVLEHLPVIRHLALLEEAGSVKFLQALAARRGPQPQRMPPEMLRGEEEEFSAAIAALEKDHVVGTAAAPLLADRRMAIAVLDDDDRDAIERAAADFQALGRTRQRDLVAVAAALADPRRDELRSAARLWHLIVAASDPADRRNIVELDSESRLEWLERRSRFREWMGERRGGGPGAIEGGPALRGPGAAPGQGPDGRPRWQGPRGEGRQQGPRGEGGGPQGPRFEGRPRGDFGPREGLGPREGGGPRPDAGPPPERREPPRPSEPPPGAADAKAG
jgi:hypothetical protein